MNEDHDPTGLDLAEEIAQAAVEAAAYGLVLPEPSPPRQRIRGRPREQEQQRSGAHPDDRDPQLVGAVLDSVIRERGWKRRIGLSTVLRRWAELVGEDNAQHSRPVNFADGVLVVDCDSTAWASAMRYAATQIVARLNHRLGERTVLRIEFRGPKPPSWKRGPRSVAGRGPRDTYG